MALLCQVFHKQIHMKPWWKFWEWQLRYYRLTHTTEQLDHSYGSYCYSIISCTGHENIDIQHASFQVCILDIKASFIQNATKAHVKIRFRVWDGTALADGQTSSLCQVTLLLPMHTCAFRSSGFLWPVHFCPMRWMPTFGADGLLVLHDGELFGHVGLAVRSANQWFPVLESNDMFNVDSPQAVTYLTKIVAQDMHQLQTY